MMLRTSTLLPPSCDAIEPQKFSAATTLSGVDVVGCAALVAHAAVDAATATAQSAMPLSSRILDRPLARLGFLAYPEPLQVDYREWLPFPSAISGPGVVG